jgi:SPOR domain
LKTMITVSIRCIVFFGLMFLPSVLRAQTRGKVEVNKDPKVDSLIGNYLVGGKGNVAEPASSSGFRVQIFSGSDRKAAYSTQARFQDKYPAIRTYLTYTEPNFKVRVGDFRSHLEAEKMMQDLKSAFTSLFIVSEKINLPKLDTE